MERSRKILNGIGIGGNRWKNRDNLNWRIVKIDLNPEKSPGDIRRLTVAQTPVKSPRLVLVWKISWGKWSTCGCPSSLNLTIRINGICTTQNPSWKMKGKNTLGFEIQNDNLISARPPGLVIVNKKENLPSSGLCHSGWSHVKTEGKRKEG